MAYNRIIPANCLDPLAGLPSLPDACAVLAIVDGPYNLGKYEGDRMDWSKFENFYCELFYELRRVLCDGAQVYVFAPQRDQVCFRLQSLLAEYFHWRRQIIWYHKNGFYGGREWGWCYESILWVNKGGQLSRWNIDDTRVPYAVPTISGANLRGAPSKMHECGARPGDVWEVKRISAVCGDVNYEHPTQKPEALAERMIRVASDPDDLVVVPFAGSGTECAVAARLGRQFISWDICEKYVELARERIRAVQTGVTMAERKRGQKGLFESEEIST